MTTYPQKRKPGRISAAFSFEEELSDCLFCFFLPGTTPTLKSRLSIVSSFGKASRPFHVSWCEIPLEGKNFFCGEIGAGGRRREERGKKEIHTQRFRGSSQVGIEEEEEEGNSSASAAKIDRPWI